MPDISLIHGKSLVAAWEKGQEGVEVRQTDRYKMLISLSRFSLIFENHFSQLSMPCE